MSRLFILLIACWAPPAHAGKMIVLGDSLSVESAFIFRFIEPGGDLWHERIADELGLARAYQSGFLNRTGTNQAVAGDVVSGLAAQVSRFRNNHNWETGDLCLLWIGGNDVRNYILGPTLASDMENLAAEIGNRIRELAQTDQVDHFLVPNLPDIGSIPKSLGNPSAAAARTTVTIAFNAALETELNDLTNELTGVTIYQLDIFNLFDQMLMNSLDYGFLNVTEPYASASGSPDPTTYAFYDDIHPTTRSHQYVGLAALLLVDTSRPIELFSQSIEPDLSLRQTWLANPGQTYQVLSGTDLNNLSEAASVNDSPAYTIVVPAPGPARSFYQTRTSAP